MKVMTDEDRRAIYLSQAVEQAKAAIGNGSGSDLAAIVNKMHDDGYRDQANELAFIIATTLLGELIEHGAPDDVIQVILLAVDDDE